MPRSTAIVLVAVSLALPSTINAQVVAPANLNPGDQYQVVFVSSILTLIDADTFVPPATPLFGGLDAADYTVTLLASQSVLLPEWNGNDIIWHAILSTSSHNARDRVPITAPLYNTHGELVAANQAELWDGSIANPIAYDENGLENLQPIIVWTGTNTDGTWSGVSAGTWDSPTSLATTGNLSSTISWIKNPFTISASSAARLYGLSPVRTLSANPGDANIDGWIDGADYTAWADHFLQTGQLWRQGDFTGDGLVDGADYTVWADNFAPFPTGSLSAVPEPSTLALFGLGAIGLLAQRLRRRSTRLFSAVVVAVLCGLPSTLSAQVVAPGNLNPGDQYQLVFVTSTLHGIDADTFVPPATPLFGGLDAADYTVTMMAAYGDGLLPEWNSIDIVWHAILSTSSHDARDRVPITAPLYNTNGELVAANQADLWDGSITNTIKYDENGLQPFNKFFVWSGTKNDGTWSGVSVNDWNNPFGSATSGNILLPSARPMSRAEVVHSGSSAV